MRLKPPTRDQLAKFLPTQESLRSFEILFQTSGQFEIGYGTGAILIGSDDDRIVGIDDVVTGNVLLSGGLNLPPVYGKVGLTTHVTGTLPIANGGTNSAIPLSGGSIMISSGSAIVQGVAGTATTVLHGNPIGAPTYGPVVLTSDVSGVLPVANGGSGISSFGTGVATALGINVGSPGSFVVFNGALGTPSSGTLTSATGLPISTGLTGAGTGVLAALAVNVGTAGSFVLNGGALGTPLSGTLTNCTGLPTGGIVGGISVVITTAPLTGGGTTGTMTFTNGVLTAQVAAT